MSAGRQLWLLDAQGCVLGSAGAVPVQAGGLHDALVEALGPGRSVLQALQAHADAGDADAQVVRQGLLALLSRRQTHFEHRAAAWRAEADALAPGAPAAAVVTLHAGPSEAVGELERLRGALAAAERQLAAVQAVAGLGTWQVDLDRRRVRYEPEVYRVLHRDPALGPMPARELRERAHPDDLATMLDARARVYRGEPMVCSRFRLRCDDGVERWLETRITLEPAQHGRGPMVVGTVRDVSDLMRAQRELERHRERLEDLVVSRTVQLAETSQRAEAAGRARSTLLSHTSHEIRTPLNVIASLAHLMRRSLPDGAMTERVLAIEQAAQHLSTIVDDVLVLAHGGDDGGGAARPIDAAQLLAEVAAILGPSLQARGLVLRLDVPAVPWALSGDAVRVRQAVFSALAWAATAAAQGEVVLRAHVDATEAGAGRALLNIEAEARVAVLPRSFDDHPDLAALEHVVDQLDGQVRLQPLPAQGLRCSLAVPLVAQPVVQPAAPDAAPTPPSAVALRLRERHAGRRVLVAEDDEINQMALLELLTDVGLLVDTVDDGRAAVEHMAARPYALALLDLRMPHLDGQAAARAMRSLPGGRSTPIIAISANAFDEDRQACKAAGMNDFLAKPIEVGLLYETLLRWLDPALAPSPAPSPAAPVPAPTERGPHPAVAPLFGLEGIDAEGGLAAVGGRAELYRRLLGVFGQTHGDDGAAVQQLLACGDGTAAAALAHRVRGSAATLGLVDVETAAADLEHAIDAGMACSEATPLGAAFSSALDGTVQRLRLALGR